jgi:hypothetical protein
MTLRRRHCLALLSSAGVPWSATLAAAQSGGLVGAPPAAQQRVGAAWRAADGSGPFRAGVLRIDWTRSRIEIVHGIELPSRPHGLMAAADGSLLVVAARPGRWLLRIGADGRIQRELNLDREGDTATLGGHAIASPDGRLLFTSETDARSGQGRIGVRDGATLGKLDEWPSHGREPHQLLLSADGHLMVANGGIRRGADDRKADLDAMESSLVRLDARSGAFIGQWRLDDRRLSIRHLAWAAMRDGHAPVLGLALQAEHDDVHQRRQAPVLALWDHEQGLQVPTRAVDAGGYAGDIAAAADGAFVISNNRLHRAWLWRPQRAADLTAVARLHEAYALATWGATPAQGVLVAAAAGIARWHPTLEPMLVRWPEPMVLDNHWVCLEFPIEAT